MSAKLSVPLRIAAALAACLLLTFPAADRARGDWPMWRYDAGRSAASPEELPEGLELLWTFSGGAREQAWDDPLNLDLMTYDRLFEPVVAGGRMFVPFSDRDKVAAFDVDSGRELWSFYTDAPVRMPPAVHRDKVYFSSDDGRLYCVDAATGKADWQFFGGPQAPENFANRKVIGNKRIISAWPARGGPVVRDDKVYFASSIWPFMGVFIYAMDAESGEVVWVNDSSGSAYIKQPHSAPSFAGVGPQGALVATADDLIVPGGRSVPAVFDRAGGKLKYFELNAGGKGTGGSFVIADDKHYFVHTRLKGVREFKLKDGNKTSFTPNEPVLHGDLVYTAEEQRDGTPVVRAYNAERKVVWEVEADGRGDLILAGNTLYAAAAGGVAAIKLPADKDSQPEVASTIPVEGQVERLLAAGGKLFAVTLEGDIHAFGRPAGESVASRSAADDKQKASAELLQHARDLFAKGDAQGYGLWFGGENADLILAAAEVSPFEQLAVVDSDADRVASLRTRLDRAGLYGKVTVHHSRPEAYNASPYLAHMVFVSPGVASELVDSQDVIANLYEAVRPYGGTMIVTAGSETATRFAQAARRLELEKADIELASDSVKLTRIGQLPGAGDWTHQHGNIANTRKSDDSRVSLPLGLLWFGGSSNMDVLPRHGHGPPQQIVGGRLYIQGINSLSCRDVYTGRVLWKREFEDLGTYDVYYDDTYKETPLDPSYNQVHIPGSNARGTNYVVTADRVYIVEGSICHVLDPATGELMGEIALPQEDSDDPNEWGFLGVYGDVLIGGVGFAKYRDRLDISFEDEDSELKSSRAGFGSKSLDRAGSMALVGMDRMTGKPLWKVDARHSFWHNGIVAGGGKIYCLDKHPQPVEDKLKRRGRALPSNYRIVAIDPASGKTSWQVEEGIFGTWLSYSEQHDLLLQAGASASDRLSAEVSRGMAVYRGSDGELQWRNDDRKYSGPCILHNDLIITNTNSYSESAGAFYIDSGEPYLIDNPLTGEPEQWKITRAYGCNTILASENLLTFRSGAAGFYDLKNHGGTGNFGGFKSGCSANLIAADGILNAPDYTRTCSCAYQNQTSLALVHMPEIETWTISVMTHAEAPGTRLKSLGVNLGAPGQRRDAQGLIWIESPTVAGDPPPIKVKVSGETQYFSRHSSAIRSAEYPWVFASGVEGEADIRIATTITEKKKDKKDDAKKDEDGKKAESKDTPRETAKYRLKLYFGTPENVTSQGTRLFDVSVQGKTMEESIRLDDGEVAVREFSEIEVDGEVRIRLIAKEGTPVLSGVELQKVE